MTRLPPSRLKKGPDGAGKLTIGALTPERWPDLVRLFGPRGACGGCWCMWWRLPRSDFNRGQGAGNRRLFRRLVQDGPPPGLLAYVDGEPAGWVAVGRRGDFPVLARSRLLQPVDDRPVWSVVCLFVDRRFRRRGLSVALLEAAGRFARARGAIILEGYPTDARGQSLPAAFVWTGLVPAYRRAGFREVARRSPTRPMMRKTLRPRRVAARRA
ncbi:MAG TPA: GNAT family N-acetyltransferase [Anaerolineales bacterium]|nr:GNAT family N-acetyltransferase [Anaerolineales bacterium]